MHVDTASYVYKRYEIFLTGVRRRTVVLNAHVGILAKMLKCAFGVIVRMWTLLLMYIGDTICS
jgi:predicted outer membrane lipoprotein